MLLTGRLDLPVGFRPERADPERMAVDSRRWRPTRRRAATTCRRPIVLPEPSINEAGVVRPGQYAGRLGTRWDAWHLNVAAKCPLGNGACPHCFRFDGSAFRHAAGSIFDTPRLSLPEGGSTASPEPDRPARRDRTPAAVTWTSVRPSEDLDRHRQRAVCAVHRPQDAVGVRRRTGRPEDPGALRQEQVRPVAAHGLAARRGRRQPGAGQPRQELLLGHARREFHQPEGQPAPACRPRGLRPARRPGRERPAGLDPGGDDRRVRPHAQDQQGCRPRPLGAGDDGPPRRRRRPRRHA